MINTCAHICPHTLHQDAPQTYTLAHTYTNTQKRLRPHTNLQTQNAIRHMFPLQFFQRDQSGCWKWALIIFVLSLVKVTHENWSASDVKEFKLWLERNNYCNATSFIFIHFLETFGQILGWVLHLRDWTSNVGNPGSATWRATENAVH